MGVLLPRVQCKCFFFSSWANIILYICCMYQCSFCIPLLTFHYYTVLRPEQNQRCSNQTQSRPPNQPMCEFQHKLNVAEEVCSSPQWITYKEPTYLSFPRRLLDHRA